MKINKIVMPPRGTLFQTTAGNSAFIPPDGKYDARLVEIGDHLQAVVEKNTAKFTEDHQQPENKQAVDSLFSRMRLLYRDQADAQRDWNKRNANFTAPAALTDPPYEAEFRQRVRSMSPADRAATVANLSYAQSSALIRHGDLETLGLAERSVAAARENHRVNAVVELAGLRANHATPSTLENPLPGTINEDAAFADGKKHIAALGAQQETLRNEAKALAGIVSIAAEVSGQDAKALWTELTA
ncbi:hypothetical protein EN794_031780 [Mesorhizobium sp. M00.F.Ca.ET.151.01.1.1]|nr:hypothetical protein EN794_031780 [Mesorhizobium sp. M00.F.Ca.ET.151.01.1.1]